MFNPFPYYLFYLPTVTSNPVGIKAVNRVEVCKCLDFMDSSSYTLKKWPLWVVEWMEYRELTFHPLLLMLKPSYFHLVVVCILYDEPRIKIRCIVLFNFFFVMLLLNSFHSTRVLHFGLQIKFLNGMHIRMGSFIQFFFSLCWT